MGFHSRAAFLKSFLHSLFAFVFLLSNTSLSQPIESGAQIGGSRYLIVDETLKILLDDGSLQGLPHPTLQKPRELFQPSSAWKDRVLLIAQSGLYQIQDKSLEELDLGEGSWKKWGDYGLWKNKDHLQVYDSEGLVDTIDASNIASGPHLVGESKFLILLKNRRFSLYDKKNLKSPFLGSFPFSPENTEVSVSGDSAVLWSKGESTFIIAELNKPLVLPDSFQNSVRTLGDSRFALNFSEHLLVLDTKSQASILPLNTQVIQSIFEKGEVFQLASTFHSLHPLTEDELISIQTPLGKEETSRAGVSIDGELWSIFTPNKTKRETCLLFTKTTLNELKVDRFGEIVSNPKLNKQEQREVKGHNISILDNSQIWKTLKREPRSRLVGPAEVIGDLLIYATQTEAEYKVGLKLPFDGRYPYPQVVIHALNCKDGKEAWSYRAPRGQAPSLARLPEAHWPLFKKDKELLFTDESDRLCALDPATGKLLWSSQSLDLDESRPKIINWGNALGLVATEHTTKELLLFNDDGSLKKSFRLNPIFNSERKLNLLGVVVICLALVIYIYLAGKKELFIRRIAGLEALDEAVGRATEMGKPVLYVTGLADVDDIQTLAALSILSHVSKKTAEYDTSIIATTSRAVTFSAAQEVVRDAFTIAGRPDSFHIDSVQYISDDQFGYAAGVDGIMVREEPAANFYMGKFYAESLIFAETGHATGAIQIAGTAQPNQLPFFVAACDYTLIGEELFAASAYLSGDPLQVGSLRGQDVGKAIAMVLLIVSVLALTADSAFDWTLVQSFKQQLGVWFL